MVGNRRFRCGGCGRCRCRPRRLGGQRAAADLHAVDGVVDQPVAADQRAVVVAGRLSLAGLKSPMMPVLRPDRPARVSCSALALMLITGPALSRMMLLTMTGWAPRTKIVASAVGAAAVAIGGAAAVVVELQQAVGDAHVGLVDFDGVEAVEAAFDRHGAAAIEDAGRGRGCRWRRRRRSGRPSRRVRASWRRRRGWCRTCRCRRTCRPSAR